MEERETMRIMNRATGQTRDVDTSNAPVSDMTRPEEVERNRLAREANAVTQGQG
jgi:hypothetical protein